MESKKIKANKTVKDDFNNELLLEYLNKEVIITMKNTEQYNGKLTSFDKFQIGVEMNENMHSYVVYLIRNLIQTIKRSY